MGVSSAILPVYRRSEIVMTRGDGVWLYDEVGNDYLDFAAGIAVNSLGHNHPHVTAAIQKQAAELIHCSNLFSHPGLTRFSERLVAHSFANSVFCCNSGTEAVEAAIKFIRRYHDKTGRPQRYRLIAAQGGFHGRTLAALSAGSNPRVQEGYGPLVDGFDHVPFNDMDALEQAIGPETAGIMLEPVQGEGGIRPHDAAYLARARELCDAHGLLLFFDEVQCGTGRCGSFFAHELFDVTPDLVTLGKGIGNGYPLAACLVTQRIAEVMTPGSHGSTYGSNPLGMAAGNAVLDIMLEPGFFPGLSKRANELRQLAECWQRDFPNQLVEVRGLGMMLGLVTTHSAYHLAERLRDHGLLLAPASDAVLRLLPPFIITPDDIAEADRRFRKAMQS